MSEKEPEHYNPRGFWVSQQAVSMMTDGRETAQPSALIIAIKKKTDEMQARGFLVLTSALIPGETVLIGLNTLCVVWSAHVTWVEPCAICRQTRHDEDSPRYGASLDFLRGLLPDDDEPDGLE